jgi:hypothetical protein
VSAFFAIVMAVTTARVQPGKTMLERVVSMLTELVARFERDDPDTPEDKT